MSKHWRLDTNVVPLRPARSRREWTRVHSYWRESKRQRLPEGAQAGLVLVAAACLGVAIGMYQAFGPRDSIAPGAVVQKIETLIPQVAADAADAQWERRAAQGQGSPSAGSGRTAAASTDFAFCHTGGGTNCVVDGDTFYLAGDKVRIAGIDAPETRPPRCGREARLGDRATAKLHQLLNSGAVTMSRIGRDRDTYGRLLRNVAVDGRDVGGAMIDAGVARDYGSGRRSWC